MVPLAIPEALIMMLLVIYGYLADEFSTKMATYFLVFAVVLGTVSGAAGAIPEVGGYISDIV